MSHLYAVTDTNDPTSSFEQPRIVAGYRLSPDFTTDSVIVPLSIDTVAQLVGGTPRIIETDLDAAIVTTSDDSLPLNEHAMELASLYGVHERLHGDVLWFGWNGQQIADAPGAALMCGLERQAA